MTFPPFLTSSYRHGNTLLLHLIEHVGQRRLYVESFLDLICADVRVFGVFQKARTLMFPDKLNEAFRVRFPVAWKAFEIFEYSIYSEADEKRDGVFGVLVEVGVEDALVHEIGFAVNWEQNPAKVGKL